MDDVQVWRWMPGMLLDHDGNRYRVVRLRPTSPDDPCGVMLAPASWGNTLGWYNPQGGQPVWDDPSTIGALTEQVREKYGPTVHAGPLSGGRGWRCWLTKFDGDIVTESRGIGGGATEAEALLDALSEASLG